MRFSDELVSYSGAEKKTLYTHVFIALLCCPLYMLGPTLIAYVLTPYLLWMIFRGQSEYFLPLVIHTFYGTQQRTIMLMGCLLFCFLHYEKLVRLRLNWLFILYLSISPFFIWYTYHYYRYNGFGGMFEGVGCYLTFAAFFWGAIVGPTVRAEMFKVLYWLSFAYLLQFCVGLLPSTRFHHWAVPFMLVCPFWLLLSGRLGKTLSSVWVSILSFLLIGLSFTRMAAHTATFTQIGAGFLGCAVLVAFRRIKILKYVLHPLVLFAATTWFLFNSITTFDDVTRDLDYSVGYEEIDSTTVAGVKERWRRKSVGDRGRLWKATWNTICRQFKDNPFYVTPWKQVGEVEIVTRRGERRNQVIDLAAHNTLLEVLRNYGLYGGGGIYLMYVLIAWLCWPKWIFERYFNTPLAPVVACCLGHIIVGGQGGQYTVLPQFSLLLFGLWGLVYCGRFPGMLKMNSGLGLWNGGY